jgi:putative colanic acid biosynthesis acetyltransferase WcaF
MLESEPRREVDLSHYDSRLGIGQKLVRGLWAITWWTLFRFSPRALFGWRRFLLRAFGAHLGTGARVYPSARIWLPSRLEMGDHSCLAFGVDCYNVGRVSLGHHVTVSQYAFLCAASHDIADPSFALIHAPIVLGDAAWVCAAAYVGMGVTVGEGAVVGARACVTKDVPPWTTVGGNPARQLGERRLRTAP